MGFIPDEDDITPAERAALGIEGNLGILLDDVYAGSPAAAADLAPGDVVLAINGEPIFSQRQARLLVAGSNPGDAVEIVGWRDGRRFTSTIIVGDRPENL